jgi:hypothetical protein
MDPVVLSRKLAKTRKQFHRVSHALAGEQFHTLVEDFRRAVRANRPRESLTVLWHRVADYLKVCALRSQATRTRFVLGSRRLLSTGVHYRSLKIIECAQALGFASESVAGVKSWVTKLQRSSPNKRTSSSSPTSGERSPMREIEDLKLDRRELERELRRVRAMEQQALVELDRERQRRVIAEAETTGLRETLRHQIPSAQERARAFEIAEAKERELESQAAAAVPGTPGAGGGGSGRGEGQRSVSRSPGGLSSNLRGSPQSGGSRGSPTGSFRSSPNSPAGGDGSGSSLGGAGRRSRSQSPYARQQAGARDEGGYLSWRASPGRPPRDSPSRRRDSGSSSPR